MTDTKDDKTVVDTTKADVTKTETKTETKSDNTWETKYNELEKKIGEQGDFIGKTNEFIQGASVVFNAIAEDPELTNKVRDKISKKYGEKQEEGEGDKTTKGNPEIEGITAEVDSIKMSQREQTIKEFEKETGIDRLSEDERKDVRKKIGGFLNDFGWSLEKIPTNKLKDNLQKAYLGTHAEKLREEGKLEGFTNSRELDNATMGSVGGQTLTNADGSPNYTSAQLKWMERMGIDPDKAKKYAKS